MTPCCPHCGLEIFGESPRLYHRLRDGILARYAQAKGDGAEFPADEERYIAGLAILLGLQPPERAAQLARAMLNSYFAHPNGWATQQTLKPLIVHFADWAGLPKRPPSTLPPRADAMMEPIAAAEAMALLQTRLQLDRGGT